MIGRAVKHCRVRANVALWFDYRGLRGAIWDCLSGKTLYSSSLEPRIIFFGHANLRSLQLISLATILPEQDCRDGFRSHTPTTDIANRRREPMYVQGEHLRVG